MQKIVDIDRIDTKQGSYRITTDDDIEPLIHSIKVSGLINPPLVRSSGRGYIVVSGFKRLRALAANQIFKTCVTVLDGDDGLDERCAMVAISDNAFQRELNSVELSRGVLLLKPALNFQRIARISGAVFNKTMNAGFVEKLYRLGSMPNEIHRLILDGRLSMTGALKLDGYPEDTLWAFVKLFTDVKLGLNKQLEVITNIHEISARDKISCFDLILSKDIQAILNNNPDNPSARGGLLRIHLARLRYPKLSAARQAFQERVSALGFGKELRLDPPVNFESMDYTISFKFNSFHRFETQLKKLESSSLHTNLRRIFK